MRKILFSLTLILCTALSMRAQTPTPTPVVVNANQIKLAPTYAGDVTAAENVLEISQPNGHKFAFNVTQVKEGSDPDDNVVCQGWNVNRENAAEPTLRWCMEREFNGNYETYWENYTPEGGWRRDEFRLINRTTGATGTIYSASDFYGGGWLSTGAPELHVGPTETLVMKAVRIQSDSIKFETITNGGAAHKQIQIIPHPDDSATTALRYGDANGIYTALVGGELQIKKASGDATVNIVGKLKLNGTEILGSQCANVPTASGDRDDLQRAINGTIACLVSLKLMAPPDMGGMTGP